MKINIKTNRKGIWKKGKCPMIKIALIGIAAVFAAIQFKNGKTEYGLLISIAACLLIFFFGIGKIDSILSVINRIQGYIGINKEYIQILLKIIGITYVSEFSASLCRDAGYGAIASQIEFVGKISILAVSLPILMALLDTIGTLF